MKSIKIASGAGYAGDRVCPALDIIKADVADYMIFECLAERTIALAQKEKQENPDRGYNHLLEYRMEQVIPLLAKHPIKIITNMGAANPVAAAKKISAIAMKHGLSHLKVVAVVGDDVFDYVKEHPELRVVENHLTLAKVTDEVISANAYIGAAGIYQALAEGADLVVTGRVADPALVTGPLMYEFGCNDDFDFLGKTVVAGHLLECGAQVCGGYFADPGKKEVPELWNLGFPIITVYENGDLIIEKLPHTGGLIDVRTVKEQLLYEVQDPATYLTPDVVADFSNICVEQVADHQVKVTGATGRASTGKLKVSVGYCDGWIGTGEISYGGENCVARAKLAIQIIKKRLELYEFEPLDVRYELLGVNSLYQSTEVTNLQEVRMRVAIRVETKAQAEALGREVETLYTNGPAGGGGVRTTAEKVVSVVSVLIPSAVVSQEIKWIQGGVADEVI